MTMVKHSHSASEPFSQKSFLQEQPKMAKEHSEWFR